jgi:elongation factor Ts
MEITASLVKELREKTGVGMMECKKALQENGGDLEKAIIWLRERGLSRAAKKAGRVTSEGLVEVLVSADATAGVVVEVNCETDFVSKNDDFKNFTKTVAELALTKKIGDAEALAGEKLASGETVQDRITALIATIGENLSLRRVALLTTNAGTIAGYIHMGGKIGALVRIEPATGDVVKELGKDLAMHVAAAAPKYLNETEVDPAELEQEKDLARKKLAEQKKPADMIEKILAGQMVKFYKEVCFVEQGFIKDPNISIKKLVEEKAKGAQVTGFVRYNLGEGLEKRKDNFAEEVAATSKGV